MPEPRPEVPLARPGGGRPLAVLRGPVLFALSNPSADAARRRGGRAPLVSRSDRRGRSLPHVRRRARWPSRPRRGRPAAAPSALPALCISSSARSLQRCISLFSVAFVSVPPPPSAAFSRRPITHPQSAGPAAWRPTLARPPLPRWRAGGTAGGGEWTTGWAQQAVEKPV